MGERNWEAMRGRAVKIPCPLRVMSRSVLVEEESLWKEEKRKYSRPREEENG